MIKKAENKGTDPQEKETFPLPIYPEKEDIYNQATEEPFAEEEQEFTKEEENVPGQDLDVPGAELDDADEAIGEEDEENNYYSLGGDNHEDLEEDKGE